MTGDSHSNYDTDFLDEDFVIDDLVSANDELEDLFDEPAHPEDDSALEDTKSVEPPAPDLDEDDLLFADHTEGTEASEEFKTPVFVDAGGNDMDGDNLDLDIDCASGATIELEAEAADPKLNEAKECFTDELGSLLNEEEFAFDSEESLDLASLAGEVSDCISDIAQLGPFVLDDGDGLCAGEFAEPPEPTPDALLAEASGEVAATERTPTYEDLIRQQKSAGTEGGFQEVELGRVDESEADFTYASDDDCDSFDLELDVTDDEGVPPVQELEDDSLETVPLRSAAAFADGSEHGEAGWEPLPATSMDELSEVDEVQRTDDDTDDDDEEQYDVSGYEEDEPELAGEEGFEDDESYDESYDSVAGGQDLDDVDGHDIYAEEGNDKRGVVLGGPGSGRSTASLLLSVAASLFVLFGATFVILRPGLFGLSVEPERVAKIDIARPKVEVAIVEPAKVALPNEINSETNLAKTSNPTTVDPATATPVVESPETGQSEPSSTTGNTQPETVTDVPGNPGATAVDVLATPAEEVIASSGNDVTPVTTTGSNTPKMVQAPKGVGTANNWPVPQANKDTVAITTQQDLARFGEDLMVGGVATGIADAKAMDGVMPGSRAFAQLHNGNYFIGRVKQVADEHITLRVETGEVTLATVQIAQLTRLGTTDYDELQKATKGFVRLTNNNRLVGGILSRIADDHIVLEFRSNRVMLPKSAIGEIVSGKDADGDVLLGTTSEEENWIHTLVERELGAGQGSRAKPAAPVGSGPPR
jgi:hypothetical protein